MTAITAILESLQNAIRVLFDEVCDRTGPYGETCREWFKDKNRRGITVAVALFGLSLVILLVWQYTSLPDV